MNLDLSLARESEQAWAAQMLIAHHYLHKLPDPRARTMTYVLRLYDQPVGTMVLGIPHATRCGGWWGYPGLPTQWQVVDLCRIWLHPCVQRGGALCLPQHVPGFVDRCGKWRPTVATWTIGRVLEMVQQDRVRLWPPVYLDQPYHIRLAISYHDPKFHNGAIYRHSQASPMYTDMSGAPVPGPSGKYGWAWRLPAPGWTWADLQGIQPRTIRMF